MKKTIKVQAGPETVWKAILSYRESQPHRRKIVSQTEEKTIIEESFTGLPVVGTSRLVYEEVEQPFDKLKFGLIEGQHLSKFQGSWTISFDKHSQASEVTVEAEFDINLVVPFKDNILNQLAEQDIGKRLAYVKETAELDKPTKPGKVEIVEKPEKVKAVKVSRGVKTYKIE